MILLRSMMMGDRICNEFQTKKAIWLGLMTFWKRFLVWFEFNDFLKFKFLAFSFFWKFSKFFVKAYFESMFEASNAWNLMFKARFSCNPAYFKKYFLKIPQNPSHFTQKRNFLNRLFLRVPQHLLPLHSYSARNW